MSKLYSNFDRINRNWNVTTQKHLNQITSGSNIWRSKLSLTSRKGEEKSRSFNILTMDETLSTRLHFISLRFDILIWFWASGKANGKGKHKTIRSVQNVCDRLFRVPCLLLLLVCAVPMFADILSPCICHPTTPLLPSTAIHSKRTVKVIQREAVWGHRHFSIKAFYVIVSVEMVFFAISICLSLGDEGNDTENTNIFSVTFDEEARIHALKHSIAQNVKKNRKYHLALELFLPECVSHQLIMIWCVSFCVHTKNQTYFVMLFLCLSVCMVPIIIWMEKLSSQHKIEKEKKGLIEISIDQNVRFLVRWEYRRSIFYGCVYCLVKNRIDFMCTPRKYAQKHDVVGPSLMVLDSRVDTIPKMANNQSI